MKVSDLVKALNGYSVAILSDDAYGAVLFVNYITSATCRLDDTVFVVYKESTCRKLYRIMSSLRRENLCVDRFFNSVKVIKVGKNQNLSFGKLAAFVEDNGDIVDVAAEVGRIVRSTYPGSTLFFFGINVGIHIYDSSSVVRALEELFSRIGNTSYFIFSATDAADLLANVFDVVLCVSKVESFGMRPYNVYDVFVEHSIVRDVLQRPLYRMDEIGLLEL